MESSRIFIPVQRFLLRQFVSPVHRGPADAGDALLGFARHGADLGVCDAVAAAPCLQYRCRMAGPRKNSARRGFDRLPSLVGDPLADALVRSLKEPELRRALAVATRCLIGELEEWDSTLCARLSPVLQEFGAPPAS